MMEDQDINKVKKQIAIFKSDYEYFTGKTSEINRTLALAGIAVVWIFIKNDVNGVHLPQELSIPLKWFILTLVADLIHYFLGGFIWWRHFIYYKKRETKIEKITNYSIYPLILHFIYFSKIAFCFIAYYHMLVYFKDVLKINILSF